MESLLSLGVAVNMENNYSNCKKKMLKTLE